MGEDIGQTVGWPCRECGIVGLLPTLLRRIRHPETPGLSRVLCAAWTSDSSRRMHRLVVTGRPHRQPFREVRLREYRLSELASTFVPEQALHHLGC